MAFSSDQNVLCPSVEMIQKELLQMTCRVIQITDAMKIATVQVKGGATCTCTSGQTQGDVPLREAAEELSRAVDKLKEEVLMHALEGQGLFRHRRGRGQSLSTLSASSCESGRVKRKNVGYSFHYNWISRSLLLFINTLHFVCVFMFASSVCVSALVHGYLWYQGTKT